MSRFQALNVPTGRRDFLRQATTLAAAAALPGGSPLWADAANNRLGVACIGVGGMGTSHLTWLAKQPDLRVVAIADVDKTHRQAAGVLAPDAKLTGDFRTILDRDDVDAVFIATPDHWHALTTIAAARAGKHVYCEKPLANSIGEGRAMADAVRAAGVVLQTGSHERSNPGATVAKRLVAEGKLGRIHTVRIHLPNSDQHLQQVENFTSPPPDSDPPAKLDYDFWLGHTPVAPYNEKRAHFWWRFHSRYGGGEMTDRGAHVIDLAQMILDRDATGPTRIEAVGSRQRAGFYDAFITFRFENRYADGLRMIGDNSGPRGVTLIGEAGELFVAIHGCQLTAQPASLLAGVTLPRVDAYEIHRRGFLEGVRSGAPVAAPAEAGHRTATVCHLNNLAMQVGRAFDWDPAAEQSSDAEVNALLTPTMRAPWML
ncbi:Gfo/Idh/MocA family protein [Botrimarina hoheduenensis]|uniref:1,5-anhydro-D-fructose reductase n=1 Tax=Botrimarina hoheduenensis TaxID=2528000 RepID=A0A5C5W8U2_9BACT|nr:Gfo/Idh/MocA family oxidoreductase [Botrimarina hoheduenensis]TWT46683.1 1,5-anhydro-D-fructose reductase [Botrimarina hoheduenensis]